MIAWIEMFSTSGLTYIEVDANVLPIAILLLAFPINVFLHRKFVKDEDAFEIAHGFLSAVFPAK